MPHVGATSILGKNRAIVAAYVIASLASLNLMVMNAVVHALAPGMHWNEAFFWRSLFCFVIAAPLCFLLPTIPTAGKGTGDNLSEASPLLSGGPTVAKGDTERVEPIDFWSWLERGLSSKEAMLVARGFLGALAGILLFVGMSFLPPSEAAAIYSTAPFFSLLFAYLILSEVLSALTILGMTVCFLGVLLILRPIEMVSWIWMGGLHLSNQLQSFAAILTLGAGGLVGLVGPLIRKLGTRVHYLELVAYLGGVGLTMTVVFASFTQGGPAASWSWAAARGWTAVPWVAVLGTSSVVGQICLNWAFQLEASPIITMVHMYLLLALQLTFQVTIAQETSDTISFIGVLVVLVAGVGVVLSRIADAVPPGDETTG